MKKLYKRNNFYLEKSELDSLSHALSASYADKFGVNLEEGANLPRRREILSVTSKLEELLFPGLTVKNAITSTPSVTALPNL